MSHFTILRTYALLDDPSSVPPHVRVGFTDYTVTIKDIYPKAHFHRLVLPRIYLPIEPEQVRDLRALLCLPREQARAILLALKRDGEAAKRDIEKEMREQHGFVWPIQMGFHAVPSLEHVHMHVISTDFLGQYYKKKKHANSFHPRMGFFIHIDEVIRWYDPDIEPTWFAMKTAIDKDEYNRILARDPLCPHCDEQYRTIPKLKKHLMDVFKKAKAAASERNAAAAAAAGSLPEPSSDSTGTAPAGDAPAAAAAESEPGHGEMSTEAGTGQKRKHSETQNDPAGVIDVDALPDPSPAKRPQLGPSVGEPSSS
ncbi:hypothetical protein PYCCODRAFT_1416667 [Trametes coccinea BRFM310]|uniref:Aprataxin C2HE/C2H2/C2HC zinc finger domain-containing protein n=1 Tax=Trametes coccinea (strain BRFM310) TaxID=1353009 RepID=A0A1Y2IDB0_TRAC3|nr:hypothetical protein PYCCODRAFT_1416667 [Trametes coccinea BRFM310]